MLAGFAGLFGFASAFSPLGMFGALVPKDGGVIVERDIAYGANPRHLLDIYRPRNGEGPWPVVYFSYGGGWEGGDKGEYGFVGHALAARGYVVAIADYRLVPEVVYPDFVADNAAALTFLQREIEVYGGDRHSLFLMGHSAGAYNVMMLALDQSFGIDPGTIAGVIGLSGPYDFFPFDASQSQNAFGAYPRPDETQPVNHVSGNAPPVFLAHGDGDETVYPRNTIALAEGLTAAGGHAEIRIYEGANHADTLISLSMPLRWRYPVLEDALGFMARTLGAR